MSFSKDQELEKNGSHHNELIEVHSDRSPSSEEIRLTKWGAVKQNPTVIAWCIFAVWMIVLTSFESLASSVVLGIPEFRKDFGHPFGGDYVLDTIWQSAINGGPVATTMIGSIIGAWAADRIGRKWLFAIGLVITYASVTLEVVATSMPLFFAGKTINGIALGIYASVAVTYISEIAPLPLRGIMTAIVALAFVFGPFIVVLIVNSTGAYTTRWAYRAVFCAQYGVALISTIGWPFMPESPWYLVNKGRREDALKSLRKLGMSQVQSQRQLNDIETTLDKMKEETSGTTYLECFRGSNLRRTIISIMPLVIQALCGVTFVINYTAYYLQLAGFSAQKSFQVQIAQVVLCMVGNIQSWFVIDRVGRRNLTLYGLLIVTIILLVTGGLAQAGTKSCTVGTVALLCLYCWAYNTSLGATAYALLGETSTPRLRAKTVAVGLSIQNGLYLMWAFVLPYLFNPDAANLGAKVTFIFGGLSVLSLVYLWFYQPETAGRSFQELDIMFAKRIPARQFKNYKCDIHASSHKTEQRNSGSI